MATTERRVESISELTLDNKNIAQNNLLIKNGSTEIASKHDGNEKCSDSKSKDGVSKDYIISIKSKSFFLLLSDLFFIRDLILF